MAGVSLVAVIAAGPSACSGGVKKVEHAPSAAQDFNPRMQQLAGNIITLANQSPKRFIDKPPFSVGFSVDIVPVGSIGFEVQTPPAQPNAASVEMVDVGQTIPGGQSIDLSFYRLTNGRWDVYCADGIGVPHPHISEIDQETVYLGTKLIKKDVSDANAVLGDEITQASNMVQAQVGNLNYASTQAFHDVCH